MVEVDVRKVDQVDGVDLVDQVESASGLASGLDFWQATELL